MQPPTTVSQQPPMVIQQNGLQVKVGSTRVLGILQIVIGVVCFILGIVDVTSLGYYRIATGIWSGIFFIITGAFGVTSACCPTNSCWNTANMVFAIISCIISFISTWIFSFSVSYYNCTTYWGYNSCYMRNYKLGLGIYGTLLLMVIAEFIISLTASIMCCSAYNSCCSSGSNGVIISSVPQSQATVPIVISSNGYVQPMYSQPQPMYSQPHTMYTQPASTYYTNPPPYATSGMPVVSQTNVSYSEDHKSSAPPPAYQT